MDEIIATTPMTGTTRDAVPGLAYLRVSKPTRRKNPTTGEGVPVQHVENQRIEVQARASTEGILVENWYVDDESAYQPGKKRDEFDRLLADASLGKLRGKVLLIWALDRLSRRGVKHTLETLEHLQRCGVTVVSCREPWLDTRKANPMSELLVSIFGALAKMESVRISERTKAGLARAIAEGKRLGRPPVTIDQEEVSRLVAAGAGCRAIARRLRVGMGTALKWINLAKQSKNAQQGSSEIG